MKKKPISHQLVSVDMWDRAPVVMTAGHECPSHSDVASSSPANGSVVSVDCSALDTDDSSCQPCHTALHSVSATDSCPLYIHHTHTHQLTHSSSFCLRNWLVSALHQSHSLTSTNTQLFILSPQLTRVHSTSITLTSSNTEPDITLTLSLLHATLTHLYLELSCSSCSTRWRHSSRSLCTSVSCLLIISSSWLLDSTDNTLTSVTCWWLITPHFSDMQHHAAIFTKSTT